MAVSASTMDKIVALCRRRGFIFGSSEIYGGIGGFWDYGPLGAELKRNVKDAWWSDMVRNHPPGPDGRDYDIGDQFGHLAFHVDDLDPIIAKLEAAGTWFRRSKPENRSKYIFVKDPNGYDIEILETRQSD